MKFPLTCRIEIFESHFLLPSRLGLEVLFLLKIAGSPGVSPGKEEESPAEIDDSSIDSLVSTLVVVRYVYLEVERLRVLVRFAWVAMGAFQLVFRRQFRRRRTYWQRFLLSPFWMSSASEPSGLVPPRLQASLRIRSGLPIRSGLSGLSIVAVIFFQFSSSTRCVLAMMILRWKKSRNSRLATILDHWYPTPGPSRAKNLRILRGLKDMVSRWECTPALTWGTKLTLGPFVV